MERLILNENYIYFYNSIIRFFFYNFGKLLQQ